MIEHTARGTALAVLNRLEVQDAYVNLALAETLARSPLDPRDRAFCAGLVYGTTRLRARLDFLLGRLLTRPLALLPPTIRNLLRLSLYQLEDPAQAAYAVVDEAVTLVKHSGFPGFAGLTNAVLRSYLRRRNDLQLPGPEDSLAYLSITLSHPAWLAERWLKRLGPEEAAALAEADNRPAPVSLRVNTLRLQRADLLTRLAAAGVEAEPADLAPEGILLHGSRGLEGLPGYNEGFFLAQDVGAMLVGWAMSPAAGERLLDLCAAPGGKATHLAALSADQASITALDLHPHKVELIGANCRRLGINGVTAMAGDARHFSAPVFDAVLLDAPCTGTGVLRRRADLRWRRRPGDLEDLVKLQREIIAQAVTLVRPGGRLIYSTCSLEPEENEEQINWLLDTFPGFRTVPLRPYLPREAAVLDSDGPWLYLWPQRQGTDGFFLCRLERVG